MKKIIGAVALGAISILGVSKINEMSVIPSVNYNEHVATYVNNVKKQSMNAIVRSTTVDFTREEQFIVIREGESYTFHKGDVIAINSTAYDLEGEFSDYFIEDPNYVVGTIDEQALEESGLSDYSQDFDHCDTIYYCVVDYTYVRLDSGVLAVLDTGLSHEFDLQEPSISGTNNFVVNVNNMLSIDEILSHVTAIDETDGIVDVQVDSTDYEASNKVLGEYYINVYAVDKAGNRATAKLTVHVVDIDKPVISGTSSYSVEYDNPITLETIKGALSISDNYDNSLQLELISDGYTGHEKEVGDHTITFRTTDTSGNQSDVFTVTVTVKDTKKPVITAPGTITVPTNTLLTLEELKSKIIISDGLDGAITNYTLTGYENYQKNYQVVGNYQINVSCKDANNNTASATITIVTEDKITPNIYFDDYFIMLPEGQSLSKEQIISMASKVLGINAESIIEVSGEYDVNTAGTYAVQLKTITNDVYTFNISVSANYENVDQYRDLEWYEYIYVWFTIFFNMNKEYHTSSFWDFATRCAYISEVYSSGKIKTGTVIVEQPAQVVNKDNLI